MSRQSPPSDLTGTVALVTGATAGIGRAVAARLAGCGATVWAVGRDAVRTHAAARDLVTGGGGRVIPVVADLARLDDVRRLAAEVLDRSDRLDVLVHCAGVVSRERQVSADGFELQWAVNHLAPFLLTHLLRERLIASAPARVVTVASIGHARGAIDFDDLQSEREYAYRRAYYQSKLANVLFALALARRLAGTGVTSTTLHPGIVRTRLSHEYMGNPVLRFFESIVSISPERAATHVVRLAADADVAGETGTYYQGLRRAEPSAQARDEALQERLWRASAQLTGVQA
ncbi:MAG: SDR family oxidoreductase [Burkholderiales bacterium]